MTRLLIAFLLLFPTLGAAQTVRVLGGEHNEFTRLTFGIPTGVEWDLEEVGTGFRLNLSRPVSEFDLSKAFDRIERTRVLSIVPSDDRKYLEVALGCACEIEMFRAGANLLAVDLTGQSDGRGLLSIREDRVSGGEPPEARLTFGILPIVTERQSDFTVARPRPLVPQPKIDSVGKMASNLKQEEDRAILNRVRVAEAEKQLLQQIGRAATQGLLEPNGPLPIKPREQATNKVQVEIEQSPAHNDQLQEGNATNHVLLHAENAMQPPHMEQIMGSVETGAGQKCLDSALLNVAEWGSQDRSFGAQLAEYRSALYGEFDLLNTDAARRLAKLYIYFGFGAEASHTISLLGPDDPQADALIRSLARIMDTGSDSNPGPLLGQITCETNAALWAVMAMEKLPRGVQFDEGALLQAFSALPQHLKHAIGPGLSSKLLGAGARETAESILRILGRGEVEKTTTVHMVEADIHLEEGALTEASIALNKVVEKNTELSPEALIKMVDTDIKRGHHIQPETVDLIAAYVFEFQNAEIAPELDRILVLARASAGQFSAALRDIGEIQSREVRHELLSAVVDALTKNAEDAEFLKVFFSIKESDREVLPANIGNDISERLLDAGLPDSAASFVIYAADGDSGRKRKILRAKSALATNRPRRAEADLLGLSGSDIDELRAQARAMAGDFNTAKDVYAAAGLADQEMESAWLAGDWQTAIDSDNEYISRAAEFMLQAPGEGAIGQAVPSLEASRDLISSSENSRSTIRALLGEMEFDDAIAQLD